MPISNQKSGVILARVSSREQEAEGYSLEAQLKYLKDYARRNNIKIIKEYRIAETASKANKRKEFHEMLKLLNKNKTIDCLIVEKVDRALRNFKDLANINEWIEAYSNHELHCVKDGMVIQRDSKSQDKFLWGIKVLMAKNYSDNLSEEVQKGRDEKVQQGWYPNRPPVGYKSIRVDGKINHIIDEETGPIVKRVFETYIKPGETIRSVADKATKWGLSPLSKGSIDEPRKKSDRPMTSTAMDKLLDNKFYIGINLWKGVEYPGNQEPLISKELWAAVQTKKHGGTIDKPKYKKLNALLRGLIRCSHCGRLIVWQIQKGHWYGRCSKRCGGHRPYAREEYILDEFRAITNNFRLKNDKIYDWISESIVGFARRENDRVRNERDNIASTLNREKRKLDMLYDDKLDGLISPEQYRDRSIRLKNKIDDLENELKKYDISNESVSETAIKLVSICRQISKCFNSDNDESKREIIDFAFDKPVWDGEKLIAPLSECAKLVLSFAKTIESDEIKIEPPSDPCKKDPIGSSCSVWRNRRDSNSRPLP